MKQAQRPGTRVAGSDGKKALTKKQHATRLNWFAWTGAALPGISVALLVIIDGGDVFATFILGFAAAAVGFIVGAGSAWIMWRTEIGRHGGLLEVADWLGFGDPWGGGYG